MKKQTRILETLPNLLLFFLFTACMLATLLAGARVYQRVSAVLDAQYSTTTCINYLSAKVRHYDKQGGIGMGRIGDVDALTLYDVYDGEKFTTYIYSFDGYLMELFCSAAEEFSPEDGQQIMPIDDLEISLNDQMLFFHCGREGREASTVLNLHSKGGEE
ncbi:hypothetical protein CLNEO_12080 [Anaerotignum neopropionicum]|uniref:DUF4860 domain-containing protein n=1 Tax=Anaerotignum neopropionicum TaxID=36847 RepID=A0A136WFK3_9FIRM|nr:DUF4860 domain-containing protein [Anaerotignum neopropionicum]KXL53237.1 hypothetical protein CLNEO_12080 [Anaerotignum neopropionicum]